MVRLSIALAGALVLAACPPPPRAVDAGPTDARFAALDAHFTRAAADGDRAGYVVAVMEGGRLVHTLAAGHADLEDGAPMSLDTRFRIASMSKPVTSVAVMMLVEDGVIGLDDPVAAYAPEIAAMAVAVSPMAGPDGAIATRPAATAMTIRHLLTHTSGIGYLFDFQSDLGARYLAATLYAGEGDLAARTASLGDLPLYFDPGAAWMYSWATDVLGRVVEVASGQPFETFLDERVFTPLAMTQTSFFVPNAELGTLAEVYTHDETGALTRVYARPGLGGDDARPPEYVPDWPSGGGGLISNAGDYLRFAQMLANGGELDGVRILSAESVAMMIAPHVDAASLPEGSAGIGFGFGFGITTDAAASRLEDRDGDYYWAGFFDTDFFVSTSAGVVAVLMTQNVSGPNSRAVDTRADFRRLVYEGVESGVDE